MNLYFQGCHICDNLTNIKLNGNPDQKSNIRFLIFIAKIIKMYNFYFRHMQRKIRRETLSGQQRFDKFIEQNSVLLLSFGSGVIIGQIGS